MKSFRIGLSAAEKRRLQQKKIKVNALSEYAADEVSVLLGTTKQRAREVLAQIAFQSIPSIGPKFAGDLIALGYYRIDDLLEKDGAMLLDELELKQGFWTDPC